MAPRASVSNPRPVPPAVEPPPAAGPLMGGGLSSVSVGPVVVVTAAVVVVVGPMVVVVDGSTMTVVVTSGWAQLRTMSVPPLVTPPAPRRMLMSIVGPSVRVPAKKVVPPATASKSGMTALLPPLAMIRSLFAHSEALFSVAANPVHDAPIRLSSTVSVWTRWMLPGGSPISLTTEKYPNLAGLRCCGQCHQQGAK